MSKLMLQNHITDVPWPVLAKTISKQNQKTQVYTTCYSCRNPILSGKDSHYVVMAQSLHTTNINVLSLSGHITRKRGFSRVKLGVIDRVLFYKEEGTGKDIFERDIYYAIDRNFSDNFNHTNNIRFYLDKTGVIHLNTNSIDSIDEDLKMYDSPSGEVIPEVGDIILNIDNPDDIVDASFTMTYTRKD